MPHAYIVLLWGGILRRAHCPDSRPCARVMGIPQLNQPKVHQHCLPIRLDDDVLRFHVTVDDSLTMTVPKRIQQLPGPGQHLGFRQCSLSLDEFIQALPLDELHHQVGIALFLKEVGNADQVRVVQPGQYYRLLLELIPQLGQQARIQAGLGDHLLERHGDIQAGVPGTVNGSHPSLAQQGNDAVTVLQHLPYTKRHAINSYHRRNSTGLKSRRWSVPSAYQFTARHLFMESEHHPSQPDLIAVVQRVAHARGKLLLVDEGVIGAVHILDEALIALNSDLGVAAGDARIIPAVRRQVNLREDIAHRIFPSDENLCLARWKRQARAAGLDYQIWLHCDWLHRRLIPWLDGRRWCNSRSGWRIGCGRLRGRSSTQSRPAVIAEYIAGIYICSTLRASGYGRDGWRWCSRRPGRGVNRGRLRHRRHGFHGDGRQRSAAVITVSLTRNDAGPTLGTGEIAGDR